MTEVKRLSSGGFGLVATKSFVVGEEILVEDEPMIRLAPSDGHRLLDQLRPSPSSDSLLWEAIQPPEGVQEDGKFKGMVQAAICFTCCQDDTKERLLALYHPPLDNPHQDETSVVNLSNLALEYLQEHVAPDSTTHSFLKSDSERCLQRVMLVWSCNSFEGARIYDTISRINHSCDPNAVVMAHDEQQRVVAAAPIAPGDEITISYLGIWLYADAVTRIEHLRRTKHFSCHCRRCTDERDVAGSYPCPVCHPRVRRQLDEDTQYDDEQSVVYVCGKAACPSCQGTVTKDRFGALLDTNEQVIRKTALVIENHNDLQEEDEDLDQPIALASSILGARHWTTNLLLLLQLGSRLQSFHSNLLRGGDPDMAEVAEFIDSLERIWRFVESLRLGLHPGHLLSTVLVGVARALVSLGDTKSQKYASDWLGKLDSYTPHFEPQGMQSVVQTLKEAWKREDSSKKQRIT